MSDPLDGFQGSALVVCRACDKRYSAPLRATHIAEGKVWCDVVTECPRCGEQYAESLALPHEGRKIVCNRGMPNAAMDRARLAEWLDGSQGWL